MGEQKEAANNDGEKKPAADAGVKKDDGVLTVVLKMELHCEGCAKKVKRVIKHYEGVQSVKTDCDANKITVVGNVNPTKLKERLEEKSKKKVELISPQPKKEAGAGGGDKKTEEKKAEEKKPEEKKAEEKKPPKESSVVLKIRLHCDGCISKIKKVIKKINGADDVSVDNGKDLVMVKGSMDVKEMVAYLKDKLRRNVELVPSKKDDGGEKKDAKAAGGGSEGDKKEKGAASTPAPAADKGEKKEKEAPVAAAGGGSGGDAPKMEVSKMEYFGYPYPPPPTYWYSAPVYGNQSYPMEHQYQQVVYMNDAYHNPHLHAPQMFSDENPNACSIM
ncbi:heavy metal-associated isoprenylated plant protein 6-like [Mangifera indica]|uniref:heavy metal-associated isoprenylated plant protein 6-like n=1 Tax=Mangifera indica TaxID=29780 RepID=UPI001CF9CC48|nr:heavy metal-associated isoprenylated plant protein 6-like [Mangifera indica]XP_044474248.1 heavy metal-associated isoprenylated plant protein 6-like [Mangifera indica]